METPIVLICQTIMLVLSLFVAIKASFLYTYYERIGTLSLYYLYAALFGISSSLLQVFHIIVDFIKLPQDLLFIDFVATIMIRVNFLIFMYLLWKRPHKISLAKIGLFTFVAMLLAFSIPILDHGSPMLNLSNESFRMWYYPIFAFGLLLLASIIYYFWKIAHFHNGLSIVVMLSLAFFLPGTLIAAMINIPSTHHSPYNFILYTLAMVPLSIKLITEGFDSGHKYIGSNNISSSGQ